MNNESNSPWQVYPEPTPEERERWKRVLAEAKTPERCMCDEWWTHLDVERAFQEDAKYHSNGIYLVHSRRGILWTCSRRGILWIYSRLTVDFE